MENLSGIEGPSLQLFFIPLRLKFLSGRKGICAQDRLITSTDIVNNI